MIIIPGEPEPKSSNSLLTTQWIEFEMQRIAKNWERFEAWRRVAELRESCGVKSEGAQIQVNLPPRYRSQP